MVKVQTVVTYQSATKPAELSVIFQVFDSAGMEPTVSQSHSLTVGTEAVKEIAQKFIFAHIWPPPVASLTAQLLPLCSPEGQMCISSQKSVHTDDLSHLCLFMQAL